MVSELLLAPLPDPIINKPLLVQTEPRPVTSPELLLELAPMVPEASTTTPPFVMMRLLPEPLLPKLRLFVVVRREVLPVTSTVVLELAVPPRVVAVPPRTRVPPLTVVLPE